jgi:hypothetical protein
MWQTNQQVLRAVLLLVFLVAVNLPSVYGSAGDIDFYYQECVEKCTMQSCPEDPVPFSLFNGNWNADSPISNHSVRYPPLSVSIIPWDCDETCRYDCMSMITSKRKGYTLGPLKYYGHWPFIRWFGLEEPASSLFSVLNIIPHALFLKYYLPKYFLRSPMRRYLTLYAIASINAWFASMLYHAKKIPFTTTYDLASALILVCVGLLLALRKLFSKINVRVVTTVGNGLTFFLLYRLYRMIIGQDVSFDEHMQTCMIIVVISTVCWILWALLPFLSVQKFPGIQHGVGLLVQIWFVSSAMLEVFDFPPFWGTFDAHSLWHAATVPLGFLWYYFWFIDFQEERKIGGSYASAAASLAAAFAMKDD